jgi:hypothetical protein
MIHHVIDTEGGQSGSSLYIEEDRKYYVIGVHVIRVIGKINKATYLNEARIARIKGWIRDFSTKFNAEIYEDFSKRFNLKIYESESQIK